MPTLQAQHARPGCHALALPPAPSPLASGAGCPTQPSRASDPCGSLSQLQILLILHLQLPRKASFFLPLPTSRQGFSAPLRPHISEGLWSQDSDDHVISATSCCPSLSTGTPSSNFPASTSLRMVGAEHNLYQDDPATRFLSWLTRLSE
jgi:hypothetical protein